MKEVRNIKPLRGAFERQDSKVSVHFEFATEDEAEAAFRAMTGAARAGSLNIDAVVRPAPKPSMESQG
jgi:hypothetical protein